MNSTIQFPLTLFFALVLQLSYGQELSVRGTVKDEAGQPLPGATVLLKDTNRGTQTDLDGTYTLQAKLGDVLVFSFLGMSTRELKVTSAALPVVLQEHSTELEGVVVTALGLSREKKSLGYSSQTLSSQAINSSPTHNFLNNLSGKIAGLEIKNNSNFAGSTNIVLRGSNSITGNNQALIVVDGVAISNANLNSTDTKRGRRGFDFGNSAADIDPNNIESINVLKGAAATALYGSEASNGAIMITTKKGARPDRGLGISFSSTTTFGRYDKATFPKYQKQYGGDGYSRANSSFRDQLVNIDGNGLHPIVDMTADASYGSPFDPNLLVYQWHAFAPGNPNFGKPTPWVAPANDPGAFFEDSFGAVNNLTFTGAKQQSTFVVGYTNNFETGILPNSRLNKNNLYGNFSNQLSPKLQLTASFNYLNQSTLGRNATGYTDNTLTSFRQWWQTNVDIKEQRQEYFRNKQNVTWNMLDPENGNLAPAYWNNPYWDRYENFSSDNRNRLLAGANLSYDLLKDLNVLARVTIDQSNDRQEQRKAVGSHSEEFGIFSINETSGYNLYTRSYLETTYDFLANYQFTASPNIGGRILAGTSFKRSSNITFENSTVGGLVIPKIYLLSNSKSFGAPEESHINYQKLGMYTQASVDYSKILYLEASWRRDISTALPKNNRAYNYYSLGASVIASELITTSWLNLLKFRANYAEVGNDDAPGRLGAKVNNGIFGDDLLYSNSTTVVDFQSLKPERQTAWEFGLESAVINNRLSFDFSYYQSTTQNQIFNIPQSTSTATSFVRGNAGDLRNRGMEVALNANPIQSSDFRWDITLNWAQNKSQMISLNEGRDNLVLANFQSGVSLNATVGQPYGTLRGTDYLYDERGNRIVDNNGYYLFTSDKIIGNIQAKWTGGLYNKLAYRNLSLGFLIDVKYGGEVYSLDRAYGEQTGIYEETAAVNDLGNPVRNSLEQGGGIINPGVYKDGTPNTTRIEANQVASAFGWGLNPNKAYVYDASYVKLREVALSYSFPQKQLNHSLIKSLTFSLLGTNLWIIHKNLPYADPEAGASAGNIQGFQTSVMPSTRLYSFNIKALF